MQQSTALQLQRRNGTPHYACTVVVATSTSGKTWHAKDSKQSDAVYLLQKLWETRHFCPCGVENRNKLNIFVTAVLCLSVADAWRHRFDNLYFTITGSFAVALFSAVVLSIHLSCQSLNHRLKNQYLESQRIRPSRKGCISHRADEAAAPGHSSECPPAPGQVFFRLLYTHQKVQWMHQNTNFETKQL